MYDYCSQEVKVGGKVALSLSDAYHSSDESAKSFAAGILYAMRLYGADDPPDLLNGNGLAGAGTSEPEEINIADIDCE